MKRPIKFLRLASQCALLIALPLATTLRAAVATWTGASGTDTNWSNGGNWSSTPTAPGATDDVLFDVTGAVTPAGTINNVVDGSFAGSILSLQYGQTANTHTTLIEPGQTLTVNGPGGLRVGTTADPVAALTVNAAVTGTGGTLNVNNATANIVINQGTASVNGSAAVLDLSGLDTFSANVNHLGLGTTTLPNPVAQRLSGVLYLARTNTISLTASASLPTYLATPGTVPAIDMSYNPGNPAGVLSVLYLGQTNAFFVDSLRVGGTKSSTTSGAVLKFNPAFTSPVAFFRGIGGVNSRVTWWAAGDMGTGVSSAQHAIGTNDFTGGYVDALVDTMSLGRDASGTHTASGSGRINTGVLTFDNGIIDINNLLVGNQSLGSGTSVTPMIGYVNVNGPGATLVVNNTLTLGYTVQSSTAAQNTSGYLNVNGGTVLANNIAVGAQSLVNVINLANSATLVVTNKIASPAKGVSTLSMADSTLVLNVDGNVNVTAGALATGGSANTIDLASVAVFASYPTQVTLIDFSGAIGGSGDNFALGTVPASAPGASLTYNAVNSSLDLILPTDPRPLITSTSPSYAGNPGDNVDFTVTYSGVSPFLVQWVKDNVNLTDGPTGSGSTISGSTTDTISISSGQASDSGDYVAVVSNAYGSVTSAPPTVLVLSASDVSPIVSGPNDQTVIQGNDATLTASVAGKPIPSIQWQRYGTNINGATTASLTITNAQYPDDQTTYTLIASNAAGSVTNSAFLTVIVPPEIKTQPLSQSVLNGQPVSFTVVATGQPAPKFQWKKNAVNIPNETNDTFSIVAVSPSDTATYTVVVFNDAGSEPSAAATLTVTSAMSVTTLNPANSATGICYDTPLYITFNQSPTLRKAGLIRIYDLNDPVTPVDTIDLSQNVDNNPTYAANVQGRIIGGETFVSFPVIITGNTAAIYPHSGVMAFNKTYFVTIDAGVFTDNVGAYFTGISSSGTWQFTTKPTGPADPTRLVVDVDGGGDFATVQGAVDSVTSGNTTPTLINIKNGTYTEIININNRNNLTLRGESRDGTIVTYANNNNLQGTTHFRMSFKVNADDITVENLSLINSTAQGGGQAEALMIETGAQRFIFNNANVSSRQDTILANVNTSQGYFYNSSVNGNFDYIWGGGNLFFTNCNIHTISGSSSFNVTAARTDFGASASTGNWMTPDGTKWSSNGMSFVACQFTADAGVSGITLAGDNGTPGGLASWINCKFSSAYVAPGASLATTYNFWQYQNADLTGITPVTFANVVTLPGADPRLLAAQNATVWLNGWAPQIAIPVPPASSDLTVLGDGNFQFNITGGDGQNYRVWASTNVALTPITSTWTQIGGGTFGGSPVTFTDTQATNYPNRFYIITTP